MTAGLLAASLGVLAHATSAAQAPEQTGRGTLTGTITDTSGTPLVGAEVTLARSALRTLSDAAGIYRLHGVPFGAGTLTVRRLGFRPAVVEVEVAGPGPTAADVRLVPVPYALAAVEVRERREVYDARLSGFNQRAAARKSGYFVTRDRIERAHSQRLVDVLREVPGVRVRTTRAWGTVLQLRGASCPPLVFVDGFPASAAPLDLDVIDLATVEGIEVYSSMASVPNEFLSARGAGGCGVVAIWSRPARPRRARRDGGGGNAAELARLVDARAVYTADQVDQAAQLEEGGAPPVYPDSLWRAQIGGRVVLEFVVDTTGTPELGTLGIVSATHPAFAEAARAAVADARFVAARVRGRTVRQLVQLPFDFRPGAPR